ncbi:hypothetical protein POSPLADRAFT_1140412 [Postia placenta MAD-698-R-SB12]|uniref:Uncharacterized protein n=1 Tax=Postia placenta MAD-698-R-SB12 TaxID=670580 RepID=A0A1X6N4Z6_9APHY|nr:hypothetical protein POSPLADRAFT_1140412 [Postia placenta MAD-698-R-SB12]OSX63522.1 hypothetical protein POSPLADRAFT_1140412 [Postia placenta MAD-698-R-SB12]
MQSTSTKRDKERASHPHPLRHEGSRRITNPGTRRGEWERGHERANRWNCYKRVRAKYGRATVQVLYGIDGSKSAFLMTMFKVRRRWPCIIGFIPWGLSKKKGASYADLQHRVHTARRKCSTTGRKDDNEDNKEDNVQQSRRILNNYPSELKRRSYLSGRSGGESYQGLKREGELDGGTGDLVHFDEEQLLKGNACRAKLDGPRQRDPSGVILRREHNTHIVGSTNVPNESKCGLLDGCDIWGNGVRECETTAFSHADRATHVVRRLARTRRWRAPAR